MSSKKENWNMGKNGKGTKTTTYTKDNGSQRIITQKAHYDFWGNKKAREITGEERRTPRR